VAVEYAEFFKLYGPLSLGWIVAAYLGRFIINRYDADIQSKIELAKALQGLADTIKAAK